MDNIIIMIILDYNSPILQDTIQQRIDADKDKREAVDVTLADFDGVTFHVTSDPNNKSLLNVSLHWRCAGDLLKNGGEEILKSVYGNLVQATPESSYDITLQINLDSTPNLAELPAKIGLLKRNLLAGPFLRVFDAVEKGQNCSPIHIQYRDDESVFIKPEGDRVIVIFSISFRDTDDQVIARVFLQEMEQVRKTISNVPSVSYSQKEPPLELKGVKGIKADANHGFVSFVLFKSHIQASTREKTISNIQTFRNYLHYHIKCSKAFMHDRMRKRVESLLQVLNRAKPEPLEPREKKTIQGKTFKATPGPASAKPAPKFGAKK